MGGPNQYPSLELDRHMEHTWSEETQVDKTW